MDFFGIWVPILLVLIDPASLAYPSNTRSQSLSLTNDVSLGAVSQINLTNSVQDYPVYPTTCFPRPSRGRHVRQPDLMNVISDCSWIINEILLQQDGLLFQDLLFNYRSFKDQSGKWYLSRWHRDRCVIIVACVEKHQEQTLQLFNVVLAANKILKECIQDQQILAGGTTAIGSPNNSFYVGVLGLQDSDAARQSNISLLSDLELSEGNIQRSVLRTTSNSESSIGDYEVNDSTISPAPSVSVEKRASVAPHGSSPSTGRQSMVPEGALSTSNLVLTSTNLSGSIEAPPSYPVTCFNPYTIQLKPAAVEDCQFVINQIILRYPNPMFLQTFGYTASADIDLSQPRNQKWIFGQCAIFVKNPDMTRTDTFRMVDVAYTAHEIMTKCVVGVKYPVGGTADVGSTADNFYVAVGGVRDRHAWCALDLAKDGSAICDKMRIGILCQRVDSQNAMISVLLPPKLCTMIILCRFLSLLTVIASTALSLAVPPTSDLSPIHHPVNLTSTTPPANVPSSSSSPSANSVAHCFTNTSPFTRRRPRFTDCGAAIRLLPSNHIIGNFHNAGADDQFRLPVQKTYNSCTVEVKIQSGFRDDTSTWLGVGAAATQLNMACVNTFSFPVKIGGWTTTGSVERITVVLHYAGMRSGLEAL